MPMPPSNGEIIACLARESERQKIKIEQLEELNAQLEKELAALKAQQAEQVTRSE